MISSDPKLPQESDVTRWVELFVNRFYSLWRELVRYLQSLDARVVTLEDFDFAAGTYTPTISNTTNVAASTAYSCQYIRVGTVVTVSGQVDVDTTSATTDTVVGITLPVASNLANANECAGTATMLVATNLTSAGKISGDATNNRATLTFNAVGSANYSWFFTFTYRII